MRARIMSLLLRRPLNANQLAQKLRVDYKTVRHHLEVLAENRWVQERTGKYGEMFFPSFTREERAAFDEIWKQVGENPL